MTARPRVDFVCFNFFDWDGVRLYDGGAERYVLDLARLVRTLGGAPRILQNANAPFARIVDGIDVVGVPVAAAMDFEAASRGFAEHTRDAALVVASPEELACRLPPSPTVVAINHGIHWDYQGARLESFDPERFRRLIDALKVCRACVCVDTNFINWLRAIDTRAVPALRYVPNYVDLAKFRPSPKRFDEETLRFLFPRRLCFERGFRHLVTAFDHLLPRQSAIDLMICGTGGEEDERIAAEFVARHPGRVRWSKLAMDAMPGAFAQSHVVLVPTVVAEGTSLAAIEGMATNNALVATFVGGLPNVVVDGLNGMLIRPGAEPLIAAVERLVEDRALVALFAQNGLGMCAAFSRERWEARWREVMAECLPALAAAALPIRVPNVSIAEYPQPSRDAYAASPWRHQFEVERPLLVAERDRQVELRAHAEERAARAIGERDAARSRGDVLATERDALATERDALQAERDRLEAERDAFEVERDDLRGERGVLRGHVASLTAQAAAASAREASAHEAANQANAARKFVDEQLYWRNSELDGIKTSTGWAVLQRMYRVRFALFPRGSQREAAGKWAMQRARRLLARDDAPAQQLSASASLPNVSSAAASGVSDLTSTDRYTVVCLPSIEWGFRFQRPQQLARCFARAGHDVLFASHGFGAALTSHPVEPRVEEIELPGRKDMNPYRDRMSEDEATRMAEALLAHLAARNAGRLVCLVQLPFWAQLAERLRAATGCDVVYDCMDLHAGFSSNAEAALADEARLMALADVAVCSSQQLFDHARPHARRTELVRNGVDYEHFGRVPDRATVPGATMTVGYYGAIADWFDSALVAGIARLRPQWRIVLVGSTWSADTAPLEAAPNVALLGEKPYTDLPQLIEDWDCCIIPFAHTSLTAATNPVKVYEMLAAGKPVVSVRLPELVALAGAGLVELADDAAGFVAAIENTALYEEGARTRRRAFAAENTWDTRARALAAAIDAIEPKVSVVIVTYNNLELNRLCLASVLGDTDWPDLEVIVVDNASKDTTPAYLQELAAREPRVKVILNEDNRGFAAANNQGAAIASGRYLCFLNNDTVVHGAWLRTLVGHLRDDAGLGLVGPVTNAIANEAKIPVGYQDLSGMPAWADAHCAAHRGERVDIPMLAFFCVAMPRSAWQRVGTLDERFGAGMFEDDDYNRRVRAAGFRVRLARDSFVHHWQLASFKLLGDEEYLRIYRENQARYAAKWAASGTAQDKLAGLAQRAAGAKGTVIFAPSVGWAIPLAQRPHHLARVLAQEGYIVVFDCSNSTEDVDTLREVESGLFLYRGPWEALTGLPRVTLWLFSYNYEYRDAFPPGTAVIYDWIDDLKVFPFDQRKLEVLHARALREAQVVVTVARRLFDAALRERPDALYAPNAVEQGHFEREPEPNPALADPAFAAIVKEGKPIAGYYGALANWFDYELVRETARLRPDWSFVLIGPDHDGSYARSRLDRLGNVHGLGPRAYASLPGYLHRFDVATIPFAINDITLSTSPLKLFEYFAAGVPVISSPMPECAAFPEVQVVRDAAGFAAALDAARERGKDPAFRRRLGEIASMNTWRARALETMRAIEQRMARSPPALGETAWPDVPAAVPDAAAAPRALAGKAFLSGDCNVCGKATRFFRDEPSLDRESLVCEHCRTTSRYRSIAAGVLEAIAARTGIRSDAIAALPAKAKAGPLCVYDTQKPFAFDACAYPLPDLLRRCRWVDVTVSAFRPDLPLGATIEKGVVNQNLERLTFTDASFDLVVTSDVMEHVRLDDRAHAEIARVLKPGGVYVFTVPHFRDRRDTLVRVAVRNPDDPSRDEHLTEPEYHGDANSPGGEGALSYRSYGTVLDEELAGLGFDVRYTLHADDRRGLRNAELFYCVKR